MRIGRLRQQDSNIADSEADSTSFVGTYVDALKGHMNPSWSPRGARSGLGISVYPSARVNRWLTDSTFCVGR